MIRVPFTDDWTVGPKLGAFEAMGAEGVDTATLTVSAADRVSSAQKPRFAVTSVGEGTWVGLLRRNSPPPGPSPTLGGP